MSYDNQVASHYRHGNLLKEIQDALAAMGKSKSDVTVADLGPVDEFHIGGRVATDHLLTQLKITADMNLLDIGCGLGGAARYVASTYQCQVTGIDLSDEYVQTGQVLSQWLGLEKQVNLVTGSALSTPFVNETFDGAYMLHVGMNIEDKFALFSEVFRVLKPGAFMAVYDIMRQADGELLYPVPWANDLKTSQLVTPEFYSTSLEACGFEVVKENNRHKFAMSFFDEQRSKNAVQAGPPPMGLHILMQQNTQERIQNMIKNLSDGLIAPIEIIAYKPI